jgi:hypothetical protein
MILGRPTFFWDVAREFHCRVDALASWRRKHKVDRNGCSLPPEKIFRGALDLRRTSLLRRTRRPGLGITWVEADCRKLRLLYSVPLVPAHTAQFILDECHLAGTRGHFIFGNRALDRIKSATRSAATSEAPSPAQPWRRRRPEIC